MSKKLWTSASHFCSKGTHPASLVYCFCLRSSVSHGRWFSGGISFRSTLARSVGNVGAGFGGLPYHSGTLKKCYLNEPDF